MKSGVFEAEGGVEEEKSRGYVFVVAVLFDVAVVVFVVVIVLNRLVPDSAAFRWECVNSDDARIVCVSESFTFLVETTYFDKK